MSYYQIIEGFRYDRAILKAAEEMTQGAGDGRISLEDARNLVAQASDGPGITETEYATLQYIRHHFRWTDRAAYWFDRLVDNAGPILDETIRRIVETEFKLSGLRIDAEEGEVKAQGRLPGNRVGFDEALRASLRSFLHDEQHAESPRSLIKEVHGIFPADFSSHEAWDSALSARVEAYLRQGLLRLFPLSLPENPDDWDINPPEDGETPMENWIFVLSLPTLSDHIFWSVVDRSGQQAAYNYGFN